MPILDDFPLDWTNPEVRQLHIHLVTLYPTERAATFVADASGIPAYGLPQGIAPLYLWKEILDQGAGKGAVRKLVELALENNKTSPKAAFLHALLADEAPPLDAQPRKADGSAVFLVGGPEPTQPEANLFGDDVSILLGRVPALQRTLTELVRLAPSVCMLRVRSGTARGTGTAFRIGKDLLLTNHHVLHLRGEPPIEIKAHFGFDTDANDAELPATVLDGDVSTVVADEADDWAVVRVAGMADAWPTMPLVKSAPKLGAPSYVIQHPGGERKRVAFVRNTITHVDERVVQYVTDTAHGSSGAPVLDAEGTVIALHHAGGTPTEVAGKPPLSKNEGIRIGRVLDGLLKNGVVL